MEGDGWTKDVKGRLKEAGGIGGRDLVAAPGSRVGGAGLVSPLPELPPVIGSALLSDATSSAGWRSFAAATS